MTDAVFRSVPIETLRRVELDDFTAIYHRASGITHLVTSPAPEMLAMLGGDGLTLAALRARLSQDYDLADASDAALAARLDELVSAGLVIAS